MVVQAILTAGGSHVCLVSVRVADDWVNPGGCWTRGARGIWKRVPLTKKTASTSDCKHRFLHVLHGKRWKRLLVFNGVLDRDGCSNKRWRLFLHDHGVFFREGIG